MIRSSGLLRPAFTEDLAARLRHGAGIHLVSPHGQGRRRTLADLRSCLPGPVLVLQANLREHPHSLVSLLADLCSQAGLVGTSLEALLDALQRRSEATLIILHNLDELEAGEDSGYDHHFFEALNGIAAITGMALLCISEREHADWPLRLATLPLPPLTAAQVLAELERRQPPVAASAWPEIAARIAGQPAPYSLLERSGVWPSA